MSDDVPRNRLARMAAERALVRVVHHYGATPEFVVLGGLFPSCVAPEVSVNMRVPRILMFRSTLRSNATR